MLYEDVVGLAEDVDFELHRAPRHVAVLMEKAKVLGVFANRYAYHAEEIALAFYRHRRRHAKRPRLFIARISAENRMSRPCSHCCALLRSFPRLRVYYTDRGGTFLEETTFDASHISLRRRHLGMRPAGFAEQTRPQKISF